jgi:hypothetical protein
MPAYLVVPSSKTKKGVDDDDLDEAARKKKRLKEFKDPNKDKPFHDLGEMVKKSTGSAELAHSRREVPSVVYKGRDRYYSPIQ